MFEISREGHLVLMKELYFYIFFPHFSFPPQSPPLCSKIYFNIHKIFPQNEVKYISFWQLSYEIRVNNKYKYIFFNFCDKTRMSYLFYREIFLLKAWIDVESWVGWSGAPPGYLLLAGLCQIVCPPQCQCPALASPPPPPQTGAERGISSPAPAAP